MKFLSKPTRLSDIGWWLALSGCLLSLYVAFLLLGFDIEDSKGLSLLALLALLTIGFLTYRSWLKSRWDRRFKGLTLERQIAEMDKVFEEQIAADVMTRSELESIRELARKRFELKYQGGVVGDDLA